jgi:hypothetical protein
MFSLLLGARGAAIAAFGGVMALGVLPSASWASCLWLDTGRMDPPRPGRDGLIVAANLCPQDTSFAFGEWNPRNGALDTWSETLPADGETGDFLFLAVKPDYVLVATPCRSDCKTEQAVFRARRTFDPGQAVIWIPRWPDPPR